MVPKLDLVTQVSPALESSMPLERFLSYGDDVTATFPFATSSLEAN